MVKNQIISTSKSFSKMTNSQASNVIEQSIYILERYANCMVNDSKHHSDITNLKKLGPYILHFSNAMEIRKIREQIFEEFMCTIDNTTKKLDKDIMLAQFNEKVNAVKEPETIQTCEKYINFMSLISKNSDKNEEEISTVYHTINLIDPITKLPFIEPVKNKICGHVYEKNTILQFIEKNSKTKCPIGGCNVGGFIKKSNLISDPTFKRMLSNISNENPSKKMKFAN